MLKVQGSLKEGSVSTVRRKVAIEEPHVQHKHSQDMRVRPQSL